MWQFAAMLEGYVKANSSDDKKMSASEANDVWEWMQARE